MPESLLNATMLPVKVTPGRKWGDDGQTTAYGKCMISGGKATLTYHLLERGGRRPCQYHISRRSGEAEGHASDAEDIPGASAFLVGETCNCERNMTAMEGKEEVAYCGDCAKVGSDECVV